MENLNCIFCNSQVEDNSLKESLRFSRWINDPQKGLKKQNIFVEVPICKQCKFKFHPFKKSYIKTAALISGIALLCQLISLFNKDAFIVNPFGGFFSLLLGGVGAFCLILFFFVLAYMFLGDAFTPSMKAKPFCDLPIVQDLAKFGFVDGNEVKEPQIISDKSANVPLLMIKDFITRKYSCSVKI